jgi:hypothetical protein
MWQHSVGEGERVLLNYEHKMQKEKIKNVHTVHRSLAKPMIFNE